MARRPRSRTARAFPKTLTGILASIALAVLAALGVKTDGFHGKPSAPPTERPPAARTAPPPGDLPRTPSTFTAAKKALYDRVYADRRVTFDCGCRYEADRRIDLASCGLESLADKPRAQRIEAEHIFPAAQFGNFRPCWRDPGDFPACAKSDGRTLSGRACCQAVDPLFEAAHNDLFNLVPAVSEINGQRKDYNWGMIPGEPREFGACHFEVDGSIRRVEPPEAVMGDIARTMLYMADTYGFDLSRQDQQWFAAWSRQDPPDAWEIERDRRIQAIQGKGNRFVEDYAALRPGRAGGGSARANRSGPCRARAGSRESLRLDLRGQDHLRADDELRGSDVLLTAVQREESGSGRRRGAVRQAMPLERGGSNSLNPAAPWIAD